MYYIYTLTSDHLLTTTGCKRSDDTSRSTNGWSTVVYYIYTRLLTYIQTDVKISAAKDARVSIKMITFVRQEKTSVRESYRNRVKLPLIFSFLKAKSSSQMKTKKAMSSNITSHSTLRNRSNKQPLCYRRVSCESNHIAKIQ